jgi:hypothetical protein
MQGVVVKMLEIEYTSYHIVHDAQSQHDTRLQQRLRN